MAEAKEAAVEPAAPITKRKYTRRAGKRGPGRPKSTGKRGRPKGTVAKKAGRPKSVKQGLIGKIVAKQVKAALKSQKISLKEHVKSLVAKEVQKALKAAFR